MALTPAGQGGKSVQPYNPFNQPPQPSIFRAGSQGRPLPAAGPATVSSAVREDDEPFVLEPQVQSPTVNIMNNVLVAADPTAAVETERLRGQTHSALLQVEEALVGVRAAAQADVLQVSSQVGAVEKTARQATSDATQAYHTASSASNQAAHAAHLAAQAHSRVESLAATAAQTQQAVASVQQALPDVKTAADTVAALQAVVQAHAHQIHLQGGQLRDQERKIDGVRNAVEELNLGLGAAFARLERQLGLRAPAEVPMPPAAQVAPAPPVVLQPVPQPALVPMAPPAQAPQPLPVRHAPLDEATQLRLAEPAVVGQDVTLTLLLRNGTTKDLRCTVKERSNTGRLTLTSKTTKQQVSYPDVFSPEPIVGFTLGERVSLLTALQGSALYPDLTDAATLVDLSQSPAGVREAVETAERAFGSMRTQGGHRAECIALLDRFKGDFVTLSQSTAVPSERMTATVAETLFRLHKLAALESREISAAAKREITGSAKWEACFNPHAALDQCIRNALEAVGVKQHGYRIPSADFPVQI